MKNTLDKIINDTLGLKTHITDIQKLHGDASYRAYYRAYLADGSSMIVMQMPAGKSSVSEEITNFNGTHQELPFINVQKFLKSIGVLVPQVHCYDEESHLMILEDLGDDLLAKNVVGADDAAVVNWYKKAIDLLADLQKKTDNGKGDCVALKRSFDETLLNWEFDHFLEYGINERLNLKMNGEDLKIFNEETRTISNKIKSLPYGFTHRDFQSRNILVRDGKLFLIDFQDALMGPSCYDLVALLRDSYVKLSDAALNDLLGYYASKKGRPVSELKNEFNLITVQRKLKDAGRFVFIDRVKKNPNFLQFIPASLGYIKNALTQLPEHKRLYDLLIKYIPEWQ